MDHAPLVRQRICGQGEGHRSRRKPAPLRRARPLRRTAARRRDARRNPSPRRLHPCVDGVMNRQDEVLSEVAALVREVIGEEWAGDIPITMTSSFADDLELESIEFVALAERL